MLRKSLAPIKDDTEEAPWMVMGTPRFNAVVILYQSLEAELHARPPDLFLGREPLTAKLSSSRRYRAREAP